MSSINIEEEKRLIVSIKDISSLDTSIGENQTVTADTSDINYIPGYVEAEKQRRENETERISNEAERKAYYQEIQEKVNNGEFKGDKGEPGPKGDDGAPGEPGTTDYNELQNKPAIPSKISDLVNDSDFVNSSDLSNKQDKLIAGANITIEDNVISSTGGSGTGGTTDYTELANKPKINGITLSGNKTLSELNIQEKGSYLESESDPVYTADKPNIALKAELFSKNYNDLTNKPNIPTKVSDLTNDSGFINSVPDEYITETELNKKGYLTEHQDISGKVDKEQGKGLSTNDFTTEEKTKLAGIEAGAEVNKVTSVNNRTGDVTINVPDKISDLTNDKGYITNYAETDPIYMADKPNIALKSEIPNNDDFSLSGLSEKSYNNLTDKPAIPSKTSDLTNDSSFLTETKFEENITKKIINSLTGSAVGNFYYFSPAKQIEVLENERMIVTIPFEENTNNLYIKLHIGNFKNDLFLKDGTNVKPGDFNSTCLAIVYYTSEEVNDHGQINYGGWIIEAMFNDMSDISSYISKNFSLASFTNDRRYVFYNNASQIGTINTTIKSIDTANSRIILEYDIGGLSIWYYGKIKIPKLNDYNNYNLYLDAGNDILVPIYKYKNNPLYSDEISEQTTFSFDYNREKYEMYITYNLVDYIPKNSDFALSDLKEKSYNSLTDKPDIPTKTSDLTNDSNFVSDSEYVHTDNNYTTEEKVKLSETKTSINELYTALGLNENTYDSTSTYTVGDLVIYNNAIYECTTAVNVAENFDSAKWTMVMVIVDEKLNDKLLHEKSSICCKCTADTSSTSKTDYTPIPLTQQNVKGSNFYISENRIYAKKNCTVVVLGQVYINGGVTSTSTGVRVQLYKNGNAINRVLFSVPNNYRMIPLGGYQITMSAEDYITIGFNSGDKAGIVCGGGSDTYLTVLEV